MTNITALMPIFQVYLHQSVVPQWIAFGDCLSSTFYRPLYRQFNGTIISYLLTRDLQSFEIRIGRPDLFRFKSDGPIRIAAPATYAIVP